MQLLAVDVGKAGLLSHNRAYFFLIISRSGRHLKKQPNASIVRSVGLLNLLVNNKWTYAFERPVPLAIFLNVIFMCHMLLDKTDKVKSFF